MVIRMAKRIILGDRKSLARMAYKGTLEAAGYEVVGTFTKGMDMIGLYQQLKPDLVIALAGAAVADVVTVLRLLLDSDPDAVVLLYANSALASEETCLEAGAKGYFEYPARPDEMLAAVRKLVG